jgi:hypothetical protein
MDFAPNILYGVINHFMLELINVIVRLKRIGEQRGPQLV